MSPKNISYGYRSLLFAVPIMVSFFTVSVCGQSPKPPQCGRNICEFDLATGTYKGDVVSGPKTVQADGLNTIRYQYQFDSATTFQAAPDLWTGLTKLTPTSDSTTIPAAQTPSPVANPAPAPAKAVSPPKPGPNNAHNLVAQRAVPDAFDAVAAIIQDSSKLRSKSHTMHWQFVQDQNGFIAPVNSLHDMNLDLSILQIKANDQIALVAQAGAALKSYLTGSPNDTAGLVAVTESQLADTSGPDPMGKTAIADSTFVVGVKAAWPDQATITSLQTYLMNNTKDLSDTKEKFAGYVTAERSLLQSSESDLTAMQSKLTTAEATYEKGKAVDLNKKAMAKTELDQLSVEIQYLKDDEAFLTAFPAQLALAITQNATAVTGVNALAPTSATYTSFVAAREALVWWRDWMSSKLTQWNEYGKGATKVNPFSMSRPVGCEFAFSRTKDVVVTLTRVDMTPGLVNPPSQTVLTATVECTSPFSLSAGVVFSTVPNHEYAIAATPTTPGATTTQNTIIQTSSSNFHPLPLALINTRLWEPKDKVAIYASFGAAANVRSQSAGGSTAEYLVGPSIGLWRTAFITLGVHLGSEAKVGGGYSVNSPVPASLTSVPLSTHYTAGFGVGISFTKP